MVNAIYNNNIVAEVAMNVRMYKTIMNVEVADHKMSSYIYMHVQLAM